MFLTIPVMPARQFAAPIVLAAAALLLAHARPARACDLCAIYTATVMQEHKTGIWLSASEQFTSFNTVRDGDRTLDNEAGEWVQSSITQLIVGLNLPPRFGFQVALPIISRRFRRLEEGEIVRDSVEGLGDLSLLARATLIERITARSVLRMDVLGGLKLPTGDSDRLGRELAEHDEEHAEFRSGTGRHTGEHDASGVHDHDLALGSGAIDGVFGLSAFASRDRGFFDLHLQVAVRGDGDFRYEFADDLTWSGGPGTFVWLGHRHTLALQAILAGEHKGKDRQAGRTVEDTALTALYLGPRVRWTFVNQAHAEIGAEWPVMQEVSAVQIVADWRIRAAATWRF